MTRSRLHRPVRGPRGATLVELTLALSVSAILLLTTTSVVIIAAKAVPNAGDAPSSVMTASSVLDQIVSDLETATLVLEQTPTTITVLVPSRGGDPWPERIRYSWGGTSGMPLTRQYNGGTVSNLIDKVDQFSLNPTISTNTENYPGVATEDAVESLLIDYSAITGAGNLNINSSNWQGQVFANASWPAGVVGWRPTHVQFQAKQNGILGVTYAQLRPAMANLSPGTNNLGQVTIAGTALSSSYGWSSAAFGGVDRFSPNAALCLVLQWGLGLPNSMVAENNNLAGLVQTTNSGSSWSYISNKALVSQMYGTLSHAGATQYAVSKYLCAMSLSLRAGTSVNAAVTTTAQTLNHPELLSAFWELKFDRDPTTVDANGDSAPDWSVHNGGSFSIGSLSNMTWQAAGTQLDSQPGDTFAKLTEIDVRFRATSAGSWAGLNVNAVRSGSVCAPVLSRITLQSDGTQTITVWRKLNDSTTDTLLTVPYLPATPVDLHLVIDPVAGSVAIRINNVQYGSFAYNLYASGDPSQSVSLTSSGNAEFDYVRVREMQ